MEYGEEVWEEVHRTAFAAERDVLRRFSVPHGQISGAEPIKGVSFVEGAELYAMIGELLPVLWPDERFVEWVRDQGR